MNYNKNSSIRNGNFNEKNINKLSQIDLKKKIIDYIDSLIKNNDFLIHTKREDICKWANKNYYFSIIFGKECIKSTLSYKNININGYPKNWTTNWNNDENSLENYFNDFQTKFYKYYK